MARKAAQPNPIALEQGHQPPEQHVPLPPTNDYVFKRLLSKKELLKDLIESVLKMEPNSIAEVEIINPIQPGDTFDLKSSVLDVKAQLDTGDLLDIEMQVAKRDEMPKRMMQYLCQMYNTQILKGNDYSVMNRVIGILITDYIFLPQDQRFHHVYQMAEIESGYIWPENIVSIHTLELPKPPPADDPRICDWHEFFRSKSRDEFLTVAKRSPIMQTAYDELDLITMNPVDRERAISRMRAERDWATSMRASNERGRAEGRAQGIIIMGKRINMTETDIINTISAELCCDRPRAEELFYEYTASQQAAASSEA